MKPIFLILPLLASLLLSCGGRAKVRPSLGTMADTTDECLYMDEVCDAAEKFQDEYERMPKKKRDELTSALDSYVDHCFRAEKECRKSIK